MNSMFLDVGFKCPPAHWIKPDPRGSVYGGFTARQKGDKIAVTWESDRDGAYDYCMEFATVESFQNWAKECT